jgi:hypothetical protein
MLSHLFVSATPASLAVSGSLAAAPVLVRPRRLAAITRTDEVRTQPPT